MWNIDSTQNDLGNMNNDKDTKGTIHEQLQLQQKTLLEDQGNWVKTSIEELINKKIPENVTEDFTDKITIIENDMISETTYESDRFFQEQFSLSPFNIDTETVIKKKNNKDNENDALKTKHENRDNSTDLNNFNDLDMMREMLPDLQYHALRLINFLIPIISSTIHTKEIITIGTKMYKKKEFFLQTLKLTVSQYTQACYINLSQFSNYLSEDEIHVLISANAALFLSELYNPLSTPPTFKDLKQQYLSLYEMDQQFPFIFNVLFSDLYLQMIELRTQLFIHTIWINEISKDNEKNFQFDENSELEKYFMNKNDQFDISEEDKKAYDNACIKRVEEIQHIRKSSTLETLVEEFPWNNFIKLMTKFVEKNILDLLNEPKVNKSDLENYQNEKTLITPFNSQLSADFKNDNKNLVYSLEQKEQTLNSENEGEISASDIKHLSQIVLADVQNSDIKHIENNKQSPKHIKSFFDKQKDYQKNIWEHQNENFKPVKKRSSFRNILSNPNISIQHEPSYNMKKEKYIEHDQLPHISTKIDNPKNIENSKENLKTDLAFFTSPDISSDSDPNLPLSSPPIIPSVSAQAAMELYKKSLAIQGLSSTLIMNEDIVQPLDGAEGKKRKLITNSYQDYNDLKQHYRFNKIRKKEYKPQHRIPWSETETSCLMKAIEEYGPQCRDLAEREQVQLKDKARNIKEEYIRAQWKLPPGFDLITCKYD
ncbi:hypothetical protein PMAC_000607 [Pneumocystis sp. 'macacae']|nr:hypothetical protein PMAC_000607 [Pneumocystis sp. 'macacae']